MCHEEPKARLANSWDCHTFLYLGAYVHAYVHAYAVAYSQGVDFLVGRYAVL